MSENRRKRVSVMVGMQTHKKLNAIQGKLEKIVGKSLSLENVIEILLSTKSVDEKVTDMLLEG